MGDAEKLYMYAPAVPLAIALFCVQKRGNLPDAPVWLVFLAGPPIVFWVWAAYMGRTAHSLEKEGWLFQEMTPVAFYELWVYGSQFGAVEWTLVGRTVLNFLPLVPILVFSFFCSFNAVRTAAGSEGTYDQDALLAGTVFTMQSLSFCPMGI